VATGSISVISAIAEITEIGSVNNVAGAKEVRPLQTTTYTLTCFDLDVSGSYNATVNVGFTPKLREIIPR
jgi:hypothetical protein